MNTIAKLRLLANDCRYDLACACGTQRDEHRRRGPDGRWLYPVALPQGGYTVLLKTLLSNVCINDCKYCPLRADTDVPRCTLRPEEMANVFMEYIRQKRVSGLFLSSSVIGNPDHTMELINATARILRSKHRFKGYIHLKIIPGASDAAVEDALSLATAVSLNIETPSKECFDLLSNKKNYEKDILHPIALMGKLTSRGMKFSAVKCTTQFIVGASNETDAQIVDSMYGLYERMNFKRVYFSAYQKGHGQPGIPGESKFSTPVNATFKREHRLYQADFLCRKYGFKKDEIQFDYSGNLCLDRDPKEVWAERHPEFYPVRLNSSDRDTLLKVPGLGPETVEKIIRTRRERNIVRLEDVGLKGKRAQRVRDYVIFE
jgi:predicted DNA-binding helix-hairpin-helix protein